MRIVRLAIPAGLLLILTFLLIQSRGPNQRVLAAMERSLQSVQLRDAELNRDVLLIRAGLLPHYDSPSRTARHLARDVDTLRHESATLRDRLAADIAPRVAALEAAKREKLAAVEYFKSDHAVLRNAIAYFAEASDADANGATGALSFDMLRFVQTSESTVRDDVRAALDELSAVGARDGVLDPFVAHGRLVLTLVPRIDALLDDIVGSQTAARAEALQEAMSMYAHHAQSRAERFRLLLYVVALLLLVYLLWQLARLRARTRELRRKEMQLIQANKMTSLGTLVSGIAHEINNPNQVVLMNADMLTTAWADAIDALDTQRQAGQAVTLGGLPYDEMRDAVPRLLSEVGDGARRIDRLIAELKDFARPRAAVSERVQLNDAVSRALRMLTHLVRTRTERFRVELGTGLPPLIGDAQHVEQIVVNLALNALEALPDRHRGVVVSTAFDARDALVQLDVRDEGVGIPREHLAHLGEPFFTTKSASGGTGLGLAITSSLVRLHGGRLTFTSSPGTGTLARVVWPSAAAAAATRTMKEAHP